MCRLVWTVRLRQAAGIVQAGRPDSGRIWRFEHPGVLLDTTMAFTPFIEAPSVEDGGAPFPAAELPRLRDLGDRVLLGSDFPNIPYPYPEALESLERAGLGQAWLRAVCHDNAARLFAR